MKISVCIPTYEMSGRGTHYLSEALKSIELQDFKDFEVVVSDHSEDFKIQMVCEKSDLNIVYLRNEENKGSSSANLNNAIRNATGEYIKILLQDDFLLAPDCLEQVINAFETSDAKWALVGTLHTVDGKVLTRPLHPQYHDEIHKGENTISSPSVLAIRNENPLFFDESLLWLMDVEYYKRLYTTFGPPAYVRGLHVVNRIWNGQVSNTMVDQALKNRELDYVTAKYE